MGRPRWYDHEAREAAERAERRWEARQSWLRVALAWRRFLAAGGGLWLGLGLSLLGALAWAAWFVGKG